MKRYSKLCLAGLGVFLLVYLATILFAVLSARGLFGLERTGLPVIWLVLMGAPWSFALAVMPSNAVPEWIARVFLAVVPLLNLWLLSFSCRRRRRRRSRYTDTD